MTFPVDYPREVKEKILASFRRGFWETGQQTNKTGVEKINLLNRDGQPVTCELEIPYEQLQTFLQDRIAKGMENFFTSLKKAFAANLPSEVQVLLAGNASRSLTVLGLFSLLPKEHEHYKLNERTKNFLTGLFSDGCPDFTAYPPLVADEKDTNRPTGDAPFQHYVGRIRQKKFHPGLLQGAPYQQWAALGPVSDDRVFNLYHSQAAVAQTGGMAVGDPALTQKRQHFAGETRGHQAFARPTKPHEIELCTAASPEAVAKGDFENLRVLKLG